MIKKIIISLCIILGFGILCIPVFDKKTDNKIHLRFASWGSESEINILKPMIEQYEAGNPNIKIDFMHIPQNYFQKIHLLFASNTSPDIIFINNLYLPMYANAGVLEDLTSYKDKFNYEKYYPKSLDAMTFNGKIYALPRDVSNVIVYYNKDLFDKYDVEYPKSGWTLKDLIQKSQKLTHKPQVFGISFEETPLLYLPYLLAYGGWNYNDTSNYFHKNILERPQNKQGLNFYSDLRNKYHIAPLKNEIASATMAQMFLQGKIAIHISGRWLVPKYREEAKFDWDVVEFPALNKNSKSRVFMDSSGWAISKKSENKEQALNFIEFLASKENAQKFAQSGLIVPARIDAANSEYFLDNQKPKNSKAFLNAAENSISTPVTTNYMEIMDSLKAKTEYLFN